MKSDKFDPVQARRKMAWLVAFGPSALLFFLALTVFWGPVTRSIEATPHPSLVFGIFAAYVIGLVLCALALVKFQREAEFTQQWIDLGSNEERRAFVDKHDRSRFWLSFSALAALTSALPSAERHAKYKREVESVQASLLERLALPNYLAGALVGLGLVGTFVGLLGTLEDLGAVFGALANAGDSSVNPTAVFADMVKKLQDPMKGMGTAFVSSLYGLLGSLVVGLCALSVSKSANVVLDNLAQAERAFSALHVERFSAELLRSEAGPTHEQLQELVVRVLDAQASHDRNLQGWAEGSEKRFITLMDHMIAANLNASSEFAANSQKAIGSFIQIVEAQNKSSQAISSELSEQQQVLIETVRTMSRQVHDERAVLQKDMVALSEKNQFENKKSIERLERLVEQMAGVTEQSMRSMDRHIQMQESMMNGLPKTAYWKDAWSKVQDFLSRSRQGADLAALVAAMAKQTEVLERMEKQNRLQSDTKFPR